LFQVRRLLPAELLGNGQRLELRRRVAPEIDGRHAAILRMRLAIGLDGDQKDLAQVGALGEVPALRIVTAYHVFDAVIAPQQLAARTPGDTGEDGLRQHHGQTPAGLDVRMGHGQEHGSEARRAVRKDLRASEHPAEFLLHLAALFRGR